MSIFLLQVQNSDATVKDYLEIDCSNQELAAQLESGDGFGNGASVFKQLNQNGNMEIAIGAWGDDDGYTDAGAVYIMALGISKPIANAGEDQVLCPENTIIVSGTETSSLYDNDTLNYSWSCSNYSISTPDSSSFSFVAPIVDTPTSYEFILNISYQGVASDPDTVLITVNPRPQKPTITKIEDVLISSTSTNLKWYYSSEEIQGATSQKYLVDKDGYYYATTTNEYGCQSEISNILEGFVRPVAVTNGTESVCSGSEISLNATNSYVPGYTDNLTYEWTCSSVSISQANSSTLTITAPEVDQTTQLKFVLKVSRKGITSYPDTAFVLVNPTPETPVISENNWVLTATGEANYQWYNNGEAIEGANAATYPVTKDGTYYVISTNKNGCSSTASNSLNVKIRPIAVADGQQTVCSGASIYLDGSASYVSNSTETLTYEWKCNEITIPKKNLSTSSFIIPEFDEQTYVNFILTVYRGEIASLPDTLRVKINPTPATPTIKQFGDTLLAPTAFSYLWYKDNAEIANATDSTLVISKSGTYCVKVMNKYGCVSDISNAVYFSYSSVDQISYTIKAYPNPTTGWLYISGAPTSPADVFIIDEMGKILLRTSTNNGKAKIDLSGLPSGNYTISLGNRASNVFHVIKK